MAALARACFAEFFATFLFVLFATGTLCATYLPGGDARFFSVGGITLACALVEGCTLAVLITMTAHLSFGCCNPAMTVALWVSKQIVGLKAALLVTAQFAGALLGGLMVRLLFDNEVLRAARMGAPHLKASLVENQAQTIAALFTGGALEALFAFFFVLAAFVTLIDSRAPRVGGFGMGASQLAIVLFGYHLTGGCANPARWFGTAVWQLSDPVSEVFRPLGDYGAYLLGPIVGALAGGIFYAYIILPSAKKQ